MELKSMRAEQLFEELQSRLIIKTEGEEVICPSCKGLRFKLIDSHIESCRECYTGKGFICIHCGAFNSSNYCMCGESTKERSLKLIEEQKEKEFQAYEKADKIHYKDYDGYYMIDEKVEDIDCLSDWIYDLIKSNEEVPKYMWALNKERCFNIDLEDIILNECENGYEEMYSNLDTDSELLTQAQILIDEWEESQGDRLYSFYESGNKIVLIGDLVEKIRKEIEKE